MSFSKWLKRPKSGRYIRENGDLLNVADIAKRSDDANLLASVEDGEIYQASFEGEIPAGGTVYFAQPINTSEGALRGIRFGGTFLGGPIKYEQYIGGTIGTTIATLVGFNADRRKPNSLNPILQVDAYTPGTLIDESFGLTAPTGAGRASTALSTAGIGGIYDDTTEPVFVLENEGANAARIALSWVWKERGDL